MMLRMMRGRIFRSPFQMTRGPGGGGLNRSSRMFQSTQQQQQPGKKPSGLKGLMQEYGYSALGVYLAIGFVDLPLCYALVQFAGEEKIGEYEEKVKAFFGFGRSVSPESVTDESAQLEPQPPHKSSFWTKFAIAYGLHKSLIFIRLPIAAAITPTVVSKLRSMGFNIGNKQFKTIATSAKESVKEHGIRKSVTSSGVKNIMHNSKSPSPIRSPDRQLPSPPPSSAASPSSSSSSSSTTIHNQGKPNFGTRPTKKQKWWWFF